MAVVNNTATAADVSRRNDAPMKSTAITAQMSNAVIVHRLIERLIRPARPARPGGAGAASAGDAAVR